MWHALDYDTTTYESIMVSLFSFFQFTEAAGPSRPMIPQADRDGCLKHYKKLTEVALE